ncbi:MAG: NAD-dependent epimerase/dehydratase family protein, partial [Candidatus Kapaibacteriota bacterium]
EVLNFKDIFPITIVRLPAIYGPRDTALVDMFRLADRGIVPLIGFNEKYLSILHCYDAVEGIYLAAINEKANGEIFFLSSNEYYSWSYLADCLASSVERKVIRLRIPHFLVYISGFVAELFGKATGKMPVFNREKARDFTQNYWICDAKKAQQFLGFLPKIQPLDGFKMTYKWYKNNNWI